MNITDIKQSFDSARDGLKMRITDIRPQVKRADRYSIFVDGKFVFGLSESGLLGSGLRVGQEVDQNELDQLKDAAKTDKAYYRVLDLLARRQRSEWEIEQYLKRKGYEPEICAPIIEKLQGFGYVDDRKFAHAWIENRRLLKPISKRRLQQELRAKRISGEIIDEVLAADETDEQQVLRDLIAKKQRRYPDRLKLMQYLARQGFGYDDIKGVLNEKE